VRPPSQPDGRDSDLLADGEDVTWLIRAPEVDGSVSIVAAYPGVRRALFSQQQRIGQRGRVVLVGRDIGTIVLPEADLKIYLDASSQERARRRYDERRARGEAPVYEEILASIEQRDTIDSSREVAPLRHAEDAHTIQSDGMTIAEVIDAALALVEPEDQGDETEKRGG